VKFGIWKMTGMWYGSMISETSEMWWTFWWTTSCQRSPQASNECDCMILKLKMEVQGFWEELRYVPWTLVLWIVCHLFATAIWLLYFWIGLRAVHSIHILYILSSVKCNACSGTFTLLLIRLSIVLDWHVSLSVANYLLSWRSLSPSPEHFKLWNVCN